MSREEAIAARHYDRLWTDCGSTLWRGIYAFTGGRRDMTDDVVAEAFARAMQHDHRIRDPLPWLFRTAFRLAAAELRRDGQTAPLVNAQHQDAQNAGRAARRALPPLLRRSSGKRGRPDPGDDDRRSEGS